MEIIDKNNLPYDNKLINDIAEIKFKEVIDDDLKLYEITLICNIIEGLVSIEDHYVLMDNTVNMYKKILEYETRAKLSLEEFEIRKLNRLQRHKLGFIDLKLMNTPLYFG